MPQFVLLKCISRRWESSKSSKKEDPKDDPEGVLVTAAAKLKPGVTIEQAQTELAGITDRVHAADKDAPRGANIIRVHDVAATRDALAVWLALGGTIGLSSVSFAAGSSQ